MRGGRLTTAAAAVELGVAPATVRRWCATGLLPAEQQAGKRGGRAGVVYMIPRSSLASLPTSSPSSSPRKPADVVSAAVFRSRGGQWAVWTAADRQDLLDRARRIQAEGGAVTVRLRQLAQSAGISLATLYRWLGKGPGLEAAALTLRATRDSNGRRIRRSIEPEAREWLIATWNQRHQPTVASVYRRFKAEAAKHGWRIPSRATVYRIIQQDMLAAEKILGRQGMAAWKKQAMPKATLDHSQLTKNEVWLTDHRQLDVFVNWHGQAIRPWITAFIDAATRVPVGWALAVTPNADSIVRALANGIVRKAGPDQPWHGLPATVVEDNGQDYRSRRVRETMAALGIHLHNTDTYAPWAKGLMERFFGTMALDWDRWQPGWCGSHPDERPEGFDEKQALAEGALLTMEQLAASFRSWVWDYVQRPHSGEGMQGQAPLQRYMALPAARHEAPTAAAMDILALRSERRKVRPDGIHIFNDIFWADELGPLVGEWADLRFDPHDPAQLHVFHDRQYICTVTRKQRLRYGAAADDLQLVGKHRHAQVVARDALAKRIEYTGAVPPHTVTAHEPAQQLPDVPLITGYEKAAKQIDQLAQAEQQPVQRRRSRVDELMQEIGRKAMGQE